MKKTFMSACPSHAETIWGWIWLFFQLALLGPVLVWCNAALGLSLSDTELNFAFFGINFLAVLWIFHDFIGKSAAQLKNHPAIFCQGVILGFAAYYACVLAMEWVLERLAPGYHNANDASIAALGRGSRFLMIIGTVVLVPPVEECFYRGLVFRPLYTRSPLAAYLVSMAVFSLIHVLGYLGSYSPWALVIAFLQYLPAGLCLAWSYTKTGTIFAPILIHALANAVGIYRMGL